LLIFGDGAQLHSKTTKKKGESNCAKSWQWRPLAPINNQKKRQKKKKGEVKLPFYRDLVMLPTCAQKKKKPKKGRRGGAQASLLSRLGHGTPEATKKNEKRGASSFSAESW